MSKPRPPSAAPEDYPSAELLDRLKRLGREAPAGARRAAEAWALAVRALAHPDGGVVLDYALEHGLIASLGESKAVRPGAAAARESHWRNPLDGSWMVWIPPGAFVVGEDARPARAPGFSLARHPVTNGQFARFLAETGYRPPEEHPLPETFLAHWEAGEPPAGKEDHPVVFVSLWDAFAYGRWAGLTLPTEWLWEKAARGPDGRPYPWGISSPFTPLGPVANLRGADTCAVGSYPRTRTAFGCEDMIGNVSEWCRGTPGDDPSVFPADLWPAPVYPTDEAPLQAVVRGSCFLRTTKRRTVCWHRRRLSVIRRNRWVGFRPAFLGPFCPAG